MLEFQLPAIFLLLPLPMLLRYLLPPFREDEPAVRAPFLAEYHEVLGGKNAPVLSPPGPSWGQVMRLVLGWLLLLTALARPQLVEPPIVKTMPTRDLLLAVDLSGSMEIEDFLSSDGQTIARLTAVKEVLDDFLRRREGDRVGIILFGNAPFVQVPFTEDLKLCRQLLSEVQVGMAGPRTMIGDAIGLGIHLFQQSQTSQKVLILLTDGNDTGSAVPPEEGARIAKEKGISIHTVAVGDPQAAGEAPLDEESLRRISQVSGGSYFHAGDRKGLEEIYQQLDALETVVRDSISYRPRKDLFYYPLGILVIASLALQLIRGGRYFLNRREEAP